MADATAIANLALQKIGAEDQLMDLFEDRQAARSVRAAWDFVRRETLRRGKFNFSVTRAELAAQNMNTVPRPPSPYPYANRFPLPEDFVRLIEVLDPPAVRGAYQLERGAILADTAGPVFVRYVADIEDTAEWDDLFVGAFAARLGYQVADRLTGDRGRKADCWAEFRAAIKDTAGVDAREDPPTETEDSSWVTSRLGGCA